MKYRLGAHFKVRTYVCTKQVKLYMSLSINVGHLGMEDTHFHYQIHHFNTKHMHSSNAEHTTATLDITVDIGQTFECKTLI